MSQGADQQPTPPESPPARRGISAAAVHAALGGGLASILLAFIAGCLGIHGVPVAMAGIALGALAMIVGNYQLGAIPRGEFTRAGRAGAARMIGTIGAGLNCLVAVVQVVWLAVSGG